MFVQLLPLVITVHPSKEPLLPLGNIKASQIVLRFQSLLSSIELVLSGSYLVPELLVTILHLLVPDERSM